MTEEPLLVRTSENGRVTSETKTRTMHKRLPLVARSGLDINPGRPFSVTLANFQKTPVHISKMMIVAIAAESPTAIWNPNTLHKSSSGRRLTPLKGEFCILERAPSTIVKRSRLEVKNAVLRYAQNEGTGTTTLGNWRTMIQVG